MSWVPELNLPPTSIVSANFLQLFGGDSCHLLVVSLWGSFPLLQPWIGSSYLLPSSKNRVLSSDLWMKGFFPPSFKFPRLLNSGSISASRIVSGLPELSAARRTPPQWAPCSMAVPSPPPGGTPVGQVPPVQRRVLPFQLMPGGGTHGGSGGEELRTAL